MERILIVDDEPGIRTVLRGVLESTGYQVDEADSGEAALICLAHSDYDLLLVDLQMGELDGLGLIKWIRVNRPDLATIILTGFATVDSAITALREKVDDYLVKPADPTAIRDTVRQTLERRRASQERAAALARMRSDLKILLGDTVVMDQPPVEPAPTSPVISCGPLYLDETGHQAIWQGRLLTLTPTQFKLLTCLARHAGQVLSPQTLVTAVQGYECSPSEARELIKHHLYSLRALLEPDPAKPRYLINVRGVGYLLRLEE
ncbi:MAG: response regulator transcription factor [Chloroflexi bacterium]|nr:response regulator transcription factor [Chloroflexota bacterium]